VKEKHILEKEETSAVKMRRKRGKGRKRAVREKVMQPRRIEVSLI